MIFINSNFINIQKYLKITQKCVGVGAKCVGVVRRSMRRSYLWV